MRLLALTAVATSVSGVALADVRVLYESEHIRFVEITHWPGQTEPDPQPFAAVIAMDAPSPALREEDASVAGPRALRPDGQPYPWCQVAAAQGARNVTVSGDFPLHYYRIEYKRLDGDGFAANWKQWYPWMLEPVAAVADPGHDAKGPALSADWPFPAAYDAVVAAPANHVLRYDDAHVQLLEVVVRPGERENMHGHPYPSVFADDGAGFAPVVVATNELLDPASGNPRGAVGRPPDGIAYPSCYAAKSEAPHRVTVTGTVPNHFYRVHFKRVDGENIRTQWRQWYLPAGR